MAKHNRFIAANPRGKVRTSAGGLQQSLAIGKPVPCACVTAKGKRTMRASPSCPTCKGTGWYLACDACQGAGWDGERQEMCAHCKGKGVK